MTQEEKAKAYDEIIEKSTKMHNENCEACKACIEELIPELKVKESKDEKIKKAIVWCIDTIQGELGINDPEGLPISELKSWLEKQGNLVKHYEDKLDKCACDYFNKGYKKALEEQDEQKPYVSETMNEKGDFDNGFTRIMEKEQKPVIIIPKFRIGDNIKTTNEEPLTITKIDDKGYWSEDLFICGFYEECIWDLVEQKPAEWTHKDGKNLAELWEILSVHRNTNPQVDNLMEWVKDLVSYKRQEWSEEDEEKINEIIDYLDYKGHKTDVEFLKSLRPQNRWKPSENKRT